MHPRRIATQEATVRSLRQTLCLPLDDLLYITRQYINPEVSRSGIARLLKREGMARLEARLRPRRHHPPLAFT